MCASNDLAVGQYIALSCNTYWEFIPQIAKLKEINDSAGTVVVEWLHGHTMEPGHFGNLGQSNSLNFALAIYITCTSVFHTDIAILKQKCARSCVGIESNSQQFMTTQTRLIIELSKNEDHDDHDCPLQWWWWSSLKRTIVDTNYQS